MTAARRSTLVLLLVSGLIISLCMGLRQNFERREIGTPVHAGGVAAVR